MTSARTATAAAVRADHAIEAEIQLRYGTFRNLLEAATTLDQRRAAWRSRNGYTARLLAVGWRTKELAAASGHSQSSISTWATKGQDAECLGLAVPHPLDERPELTNPGLYLSVAVAAELCGVNRHTVRNWIRAGYLPARRSGNRPGSAWRIAKADLERLLRVDGARSVAEVAEWYRVSEQTVRSWLRSGRLRAERTDRRGIYRMDRDILEARTQPVV